MMKFTRTLFLVSLVVLLASCMKHPEANPDNNGNNGNNGGGQQQPTTAKTAADIVISQLAILPEFNEGIYEDIVFAQHSDSQEVPVRHFRIANLSTPLKASFTSNAVSVKVGNVTQVSGVTGNNFSSEVVFKFFAEDGDAVDRRVKISNPANQCSGLPIISLLTNKRVNITNANKETWQRGKVWIDKSLSDVMERSDSIEMKGRGHLTWTLEKKPYNFRLLEKKSGANMLGMKEHKRWVLLANHADRTLLRNKVAYEIAKRVGLTKEANDAWTSDTRWVEVFFNGKFLGNYLLTEQIRIDKNRVNIKETDNTATGEDITGGYLIEIDRYYDEGHRFKPVKSQMPVMIKEPDPMNAAQKTYIENYFEQVENLLFPTPPAVIDMDAYKTLIDVDSFIRTMFVQELTDNNDARLPGSQYMHKDVNGLLRSGPVWDFDYTTFEGGSEFMFYNHTPGEGIAKYWYYPLLSDPKFRARAKEMWIALYDSGTLSSITAFIDDQLLASTFLEESADINWNTWQFTDRRNGDLERTWAGAVNALKSNYTTRLGNLDKVIRRDW